MVGLTVVGVFLFGLIVLWSVMRHLRRSRELLHTERLRALEVGQSPGFSDPEEGQKRYAHNIFWIAFWVGAGVPMAAASAAASVTNQEKVSQFGLMLAMWISVAVISVASVICATVLMVKARSAASHGEKTGPRPPAGTAATTRRMD
jgi:hypothetical protein